jgi:hypothetical protein
MGERALLCDHGLVGDESAHGQNDPATSPNGSGAVVGPHLHSDDFSRVDDQCLSPGVGHHASGTRSHGGAKALHEEAAGGIDAQRLVPARHRDGNFVEGIAVLTAAEEQTRIIG